VIPHFGDFAAWPEDVGSRSAQGSHLLVRLQAARASGTQGGPPLLSARLCSQKTIIVIAAPLEALPSWHARHMSVLCYMHLPRLVGNCSTQL
jgi:hypothetical protein